MLAKLVRGLGFLSYVALVAAVFVVAAYLAFSLFVRRGVTPVPKVVGLSETEARSLLADQGLSLEPAEGSHRYDDEVPRDRVLSQEPGAGSLVKRGSRVRVALSLGPQLVQVPDLKGSALHAAQVTLAGAGLVVGRTASIYAPSGAPGTVVEQSPPPGSLISRAEPVDLFLCLDSLAETFLMPDLVYRPYRVVRRFFDLRGFRFGSVKFESYEGVAPGVVLRQFPLPGHPLRRRDVISLVVAADEAAAAGAGL